MIIVLIHWRIKPDLESEFLKYWSEETTVSDKSGMVSEFLSKVEKSTQQNPIPWITWHIDPESFGDSIHYVNVGLWEDEKKFADQIAPKFNDGLPMKDFEKYRRRRLLLRPELQRSGEAPFLNTDSPGVQ